MKTIALTQGYHALIDDQDFDTVSEFKWYAAIHRSKGSSRIYAVRTGPRPTRQSIKLHRFLLGCREDVDHRDGDGLNNQRSNLRPASRSQNNANSKKSVGTSRFKGVAWHKQRHEWVAYIKKDYVKKYLGFFANECDAAKAYNLAALDLFGEFAKLNDC